MVGIRWKTNSSKSSKWLASGRIVRRTIHELGGTIPENPPVAENIKKVESREKKRLKAAQKKAANTL